MNEVQLYCFAQSGNAYIVANYLNLAKLRWTPIFVDFFDGETRGEAFRKINPMGEVPVLRDGDLLLSQSGLILDHLIRKTGCFAPRSEDDAREMMRWILWDNHKGSSQFGTTRFMLNFLPEKHRNEAVNAFLIGRSKAALAVLDGALADREWLVGDNPTAADLSCSSYLFYPEPFGFERATLPNVDRWLGQIEALPNWIHPYDLMPGHPLPARA